MASIKTPITQIEQSFRHYIPLSGGGVKYNSEMPFILRFLYLIAVLITYGWFGVIYRKFLPRISTKKPYLTVVFSVNQFKISEWLRKNHFEIETIAIGDISTNVDYLISHYQILLSSLVNSRQALAMINKSFKEPFYKNHSKRIVKLNGLSVLMNEGLQYPEVVFNFNDHAPANVMLYDIAKSRGSKVVYFQHAPITSKFPTIYHDFNVLFSTDSIKKYKNPFNNPIKLFFDVRFDVDHDYDQGDAIENSVLVCTNLMDDLAIVTNLCNSLILLGFKVIVRPHPRDKKSYDKLQEMGAIVSRVDDVWFDLNRSNYIVADESAILLEGAFLHKKVYKVNFFNEFSDVYGFLTSGLFKRQYELIEDLIDAISKNQIDYNYDKTVYYLGDFKEKNRLVNELKEELKVLSRQ